MYSSKYSFYGYYSISFNGLSLTSKYKVLTSFYNELNKFYSLKPQKESTEKERATAYGSDSRTSNMYLE